MKPVDHKLGLVFQQHGYDDKIHQQKACITRAFSCQRESLRITQRKALIRFVVTNAMTAAISCYVHLCCCSHQHSSSTAHVTPDCDAEVSSLSVHLSMQCTVLLCIV